MKHRYTIFQIPVATFVLHVPLASEDGSESLTHYTRAYWVAATDAADALEVVRDDGSAEGAALLDADPPTAHPSGAVPVSGLKRLAVGRKRGVCWKSGRVFFPAA